MIERIEPLGELADGESERLVQLAATGTLEAVNQSPEAGELTVQADPGPAQLAELAALVGGVVTEDQILDPVDVDDQTLDQNVDAVRDIVDPCVDPRRRRG